MIIKAVTKIELKYGNPKNHYCHGPGNGKKKKKWLEPHSKASEMVNAKIPRNWCNFETNET